ncbi:MAG: hypothetical protein PVJ43_00130, partial [Gemmatimonadales bacterium]
TEGTEAAFEQVLDQYFNDNPGLDSLETSLAVFRDDISNALQSTGSVNPTAQALPPHPVGQNSRLGQSVRESSARGTALSMLRASIPTDSLGTTFEYDADSSRYVASVRTGAPTDGVRFILYNDKTALNEVGYIDLSGQSILDASGSPIDVTLKVFIASDSATLPVLNYQATGTVSGTGGTLSFTGFLSDGGSQLDFDFGISRSGLTGYGADLALTAGDLSVTFDIATETTTRQTLEASIVTGSGEIRFLVEADENGDIQDGSGVFLDDGSGEAFVASFAGEIGQRIQLSNTEGDPLTQQELVALANIFTGVEYARVLMEGLLDIGLALVGISFVL